MRFVILHYHIFKNAGSTIEDILDHSFGERFGKLETPTDGGLICNPDLVRYLDAHPALRAVSSHQIRHPIPEAPGYLFFDICFLRDPIDRLRSIYDYFRQRPNPADPMSDLANRCGLGDFVAGMVESYPLFIRDNQVNLLACAGDSDEPNERDLELAMRRMLATSFLGVVDCFEQSAAAGKEALRAAFPELDCARAPVNVSGGLEGTLAGRVEAVRLACRPEVYENLIRVTELDRQLVDRARTELSRRASGASTLEHPEYPRGAGDLVARRPVPTRNPIKLAPYWRELAGSDRKTLGPLFDPAFYLRKYPDVAAAGVNPLLHYLKCGTKELRQPHPLFDPVFYLNRNPDVRKAGVNPLIHYILHGAAEGRKPHPLFDPIHYGAVCQGENPLIHFLNQGANAANPHPLFDCKAYVEAHPEVLEQNLNPLVHYLTTSGDAAFSVGAPHERIELEIQDVQLKAKVWQDDRGRTHWRAEPQQLPFLRALTIGQMRAQINNE